MSELLVRTATGVVMAVVALFAAFQGGYALAVLAAAAATAVFYEWTRLAKGWGAAWYIGGFAYALLAALSLLWVRERAEDGRSLLLWIFIIVWATDIGAYVSGRSIGGPKLAPAISPGKTWAGFYGGVAAATLFGGAWVLTTGLYWLVLLLAPLFSVASQGGDLFESWMKRRAGVKDSGRLLPGHGGVFDRLDGLLPVAILTALAVIAGMA
ncbi:phosphatidate cytidylyltransferase [Sphingomonas sp. RG327]|jgi:phosphatidate cytidylyltransferase|uniref:Phosphatidate cytidylyltransferase n=1 Tax=Sphingomonas anseongensis TaxID=2908207 RepID=A0ABT0RD64_9SPHN|nr:phosphatidate cytidylyltransferase [Sphingomonas anseongensis]MCL6678209.1 phosphatidate cytidylyltransferase [Sphingomonas anseongensis]